MFRALERRENPVEVFPITREAVDLTLTRIARDPESEFHAEAIRIKETNPHLNMQLRQRMSLVPTPREFIEGAVWTHAILRTQSELRGGTLPKVPRTLIDIYLVENAVVEKAIPTPIESWIKKKVTSMYGAEPELAYGLKEVVKYRPDPEKVLFGSVLVYEIIKKATQGFRPGGLFRKN